MSFGWSAGDVVSAVKLVNNIISCVQNIGGAREHFQELFTELQGLEKALSQISVLTATSQQVPEIAALKFASCNCEGTLQRFYYKIKPFEESLGSTSTQRKLKASPRMVRWELLVKKDIPELRSYLVAHVGYLNLRLNTALLNTVYRSQARAEDNYCRLERKTSYALEQLNAEAITLKEKVSLIPKEDTVPKLDELLLITANAWRSNSELMDFLVNLKQNLPSPDLRYTWPQEPVKLEDALGRVIPVPSEYDWTKVEAVIRAQFSHGPGHKKVHSGEYELFSSVAGETPISPTDFMLIPGMSIKMAIVVGQYSGSSRCARFGCRGILNDVPESGTTCSLCKTWTRRSRKPLIRPMKPPGLGDVYTRVEKSKLQRTELPHFYTKLIERQSFKNISIYITELPPTPRPTIPSHMRDRVEQFRRNIRQSQDMKKEPQFSVNQAKTYKSDKRHKPKPRLPDLPTLPRHKDYFLSITSARIKETIASCKEKLEKMRSTPTPTTPNDRPWVSVTECIIDTRASAPTYNTYSERDSIHVDDIRWTAC